MSELKMSEWALKIVWECYYCGYVFESNNWGSVQCENKKCEKETYLDSDIPDGENQ